MCALAGGRGALCEGRSIRAASFTTSHSAHSASGEHPVLWQGRAEANAPAASTEWRRGRAPHSPPCRPLSEPTLRSHASRAATGQPSQPRRRARRPAVRRRALGPSANLEPQPGRRRPPRRVSPLGEERHLTRRNRLTTRQRSRLGGLEQAARSHPARGASRQVFWRRRAPASPHPRMLGDDASAKRSESSASSARRASASLRRARAAGRLPTPAPPGHELHLVGQATERHVLRGPSGLATRIEERLPDGTRRPGADPSRVPATRMSSPAWLSRYAAVNPEIPAPTR